MNEAGQGVSNFLASYRAAFIAMNAPAITDLFTYPLHITSDSGKIALTVIETREDWIQQVSQLLELYRAIRFSSARILDLAVTELSPRLAQAIVHWELFNGAGGKLYDFKALYTLVMMNERLYIAAISHDEIPKMQACLRERKVKSNGP